MLELVVFVLGAGAAVLLLVRAVKAYLEQRRRRLEREAMEQEQFILQILSGITSASGEPLEATFTHDRDEVTFTLHGDDDATAAALKALEEALSPIPEDDTW